MLHAGLDLSRRKVDICLLSDEGEHLDQLVVAPDVDSLRTLARRIEEVHREPVPSPGNPGEHAGCGSEADSPRVEDLPQVPEPLSMPCA
jgi:hypothetical protein